MQLKRIIFFTIPILLLSCKGSSSLQKNWDGFYTISLDYGKLDEFSEISIDYDIQIKDDNCTFSGLGHKTYFTDQCKIEKKGNEIILKYIRW